MGLRSMYHGVALLLFVGVGVEGGVKGAEYEVRVCVCGGWMGGYVCGCVCMCV